MSALAELKVVAEEAVQIAKPAKIDLSRFKSKPGAVESIAVLPTALPHYRLSEAKDFVRLHPDEAYWSDEMWFVTVPIPGMKKDTLHLIDQELATRFLHRRQVKHAKLVLATKPHDAFFLAEVPTRNLVDNTWNSSNIQACYEAKTAWIKVVSLRDEGLDRYQIVPAHDQDSFPAPKWPAQSLDDLITLTFDGRMIMDQNHPALHRLIGAKIVTS